MKYITSQNFLLIILVSACGVFASGSLLVSRDEFQPLAIGSLVVIFVSLLVLGVGRAKARSPKPLVAEAERQARSGRKLAISDPIHGALARWYFELRLEEEARRSRRYGKPMAVLTVRGISDAAGLPSGSVQAGPADSLVKVALECARTTDLVGMLDFNSLAICLTETDRVGAFSLLKRMMARLDDKDCVVGVAMAPQDEGDAEELLELAERRSAPWRKRPVDSGTKAA